MDHYVSQGIPVTAGDDEAAALHILRLKLDRYRDQGIFRLVNESDWSFKESLRLGDQASILYTHRFHDGYFVWVNTVRGSEKDLSAISAAVLYMLRGRVPRDVSLVPEMRRLREQLRAAKPRQLTVQVDGQEMPVSSLELEEATVLQGPQFDVVVRGGPTQVELHWVAG